MEELKNLIEKSGYKLSFIASKLGITRYSLSKKLNGETEFKRSEIERLCNFLNIRQSEIARFFFKNR